MRVTTWPFSNHRYLAGLFLLITFWQVPLFAQYDPHPDSLVYYREPYRGQFHFSPKTGWMNDINGLVYQGGLYHMIYQWGKAIRHGGYATSPDLLHWTDRGVALIPQKSFLPAEATRNVTGDQVFSGSAVVVRGAPAKKITGTEEEAIIAIYTGTSAGTCLAWSHDTGRTWHDYPGNPVANPTDDAYPRDPCVIWHKPSKQWIMALYEEGTTFYGSSDLIHWDSLSNINFGYECPDLYALPLDGNWDQMKWVLQDANGSYLVGTFDGTHFLKDPGQDTLIMDNGPDFYAAQTFPAGNLPNNDRRIIQMAWMDHWNGGIGESPWERNATFPVWLGLVTDGKNKRITRYPVVEIENLYTSTLSWHDQLLATGTNLLAGVSGKTLDLSVVVDLKKSRADSFTIAIADRRITCDLHRFTLLGKPLPEMNNGLLTLRILADQGQLEVFAQEGRFSYTQQYPFDPAREDLSFISAGSLYIRSLIFHKVRSIWDN